MTDPNDGAGFFNKLWLEYDSSVEIYLIVFLFLTLPVLPLLNYLARRKIEKIKDPKINNSYCVISLYILKAIEILSVWVLLFNIIILILYFTKPNLEQ